MIELRLGNVISIGLAALLFFLIVKFVLSKTPYSNLNSMF